MARNRLTDAKRAGEVTIESERCIPFIAALLDVSIKSYVRHSIHRISKPRAIFRH